MLDDVFTVENYHIWKTQQTL